MTDQGLAIEQVPFEAIAHLGRLAAREGAPSVKDTRRTDWYAAGGDCACFGVMHLGGGRVRFKGAFTRPEWRGQGLGLALVRHALGVVEQLAEQGPVEIELLTKHRSFWEGLGFAVAAELRNARFRMTRTIRCEK